MDCEVTPNESKYFEFVEEEGQRWKIPPIIEELKQKARDAELWNLFLPESEYGAGLTNVEYAPLCEIMGHSAIGPEVFNCSAPDTGNMEVLVRYGTEEQKKKYLPLIASGEKVGTFALSETNGTPKPTNIKTDFLSGKINGYKSPVSDGEAADIMIVAANSDNRAGHNSLSLYLVETTTDGVTRKSLETIDPTRPACSITFDNVAAELIGEEGMAWEMIENIFNRAAVLYSFEQVGGAQVSLDEAKKYSMERFAFGRQIGSFQALKHKMADMYVKIELARSNAYYGAWALSTNSNELPVAAAGARVSASDAFNYTAKENIQIHGGVGFTWEYDCHLFYRRSKILSLNIGSTRQWRENLISNLEKRNIV